jgi:hypothetical protein
VWLPAGATADGSLLFAREPADGLLELATVDPGSGDAGTVMTVTVPGPPEDYLRVPRHLTYAVQALPGGLVLLRSQLLMATSHPDFDEGPSGHLSFRYEYHLLDPAAGRIWPPELPDLPDGALIRTIGDAAWLSPEAADLAFDP